MKFTKMHGLGNDFIVIDASNQQVALTAQQIRLMADRRYGIGCDQVLLVTKAKPPADFSYRVFNSDGTASGQCVNGARCIAQFVTAKGLTTKRVLNLTTTATCMQVTLQADGQWMVTLPAPNFAPKHLPAAFTERETYYKLVYEDAMVLVGLVAVGNPHLVMQVTDVVAEDVATKGAFFATHPVFPQGVNVEFMEVVAKNHIKLRVYERGTGETLACGSGACAAVAVGILWGVLAPEVVVELRGGKLLVRQLQDGTLQVSGPATMVFEGEL